jgi:hypothetical protein
LKTLTIANSSSKDKNLMPSSDSKSSIRSKRSSRA